MLYLKILNTMNCHQKTKDCFLISYLAVPRPNLTLNDVLNKKLYATVPNLAANAIAVFKLCSLLIATLTYHAYIYLTQTNNTSPCPNEKVNT